MTTKNPKLPSVEEEKPLLNPDLIASIIARLRILDREINRHSAIIEQEIGINYTEGLFLRIVCAAPGQSLGAVTQKMRLSQGAASNIKRGLMKRGLVEEYESPEDARVICLYPTKKAQQLIKQAKRDIKTPLRQVAEETNPKDLKRFNELLIEITDRLLLLQADEGGRKSKLSSTKR
jgi:DNA-binding MarR family transcriptional regulator